MTKKWSSVTQTMSPDRKKKAASAGKGEQPTSLVEAAVCELFHIGCKNAGVNRYSALENQRQVLARLMTFLTSYRYYLANTKFSFLYPQMLIFPALKTHLLPITCN